MNVYILSYLPQHLHARKEIYYSPFRADSIAFGDETPQRALKALINIHFVFNGLKSAEPQMAQPTSPPRIDPAIPFTSCQWYVRLTRE
ncbi:MAG: hypothetical protein ABR557_14315 [Pyrinomonadaceae bacterium]